MRLSLFVLLFSGCATVAGSADLKRQSFTFEPPAAELAGWKRLQTPDFELLTDLPLPEAERAGQLLEQSIDGLRAMFGKAPVQRPRALRIIAMRDELDFERRFGRGIGGFAASSGDETVILLYGVPNKWVRRGSDRIEAVDSVLQHELAHAVLFSYIPVQPPWFAEGMAQYLETFRWLDEETVLLGEPNVKAWQFYSSVRSLTMKGLLADRDVRGRERAGEYGLAWAFVHYAINQEPQRFTALMAALVDRDEEAFLHTFGEDTERLDMAIHQHLKVGRYAQVKLHVARPMLRPARFEAAAEPTEVLGRFQRRDLD